MKIYQLKYNDQISKKYKNLYTIISFSQASNLAARWEICFVRGIGSS